jgi:hypothetical protein
MRVKVKIHADRFEHGIDRSGLQCPQSSVDAQKMF